MTRLEKIRIIREKDLEKRIMETKPCLPTLKPPTLCLKPALTTPAKVLHPVV